MELGAGLLAAAETAGAALQDSADAVDVEVGEVRRVSEPAGRGTGHLALVDAVALWTTGLFCLSLVLPDRVQRVATLVFSIVLIIVAFVALLVAFVELTVMVSLFLAPRFGTLAYLAVGVLPGRRRRAGARAGAAGRLDPGDRQGGPGQRHRMNRTSGRHRTVRADPSGAPRVGVHPVTPIQPGCGWGQ
ncbi:hypothetical protein NCC78_28930 [Micromonospora phytophila]|uniref:hypothetical protein n=1 Tax=Micromonospora phytophila TaxID=709888 RepID=UPI00202F8A86|nr:hypothetical protein [Micromonospora phytophila]MCM0678667.1 hypothetical protein [Micromonospora phytophila]